MGRPVHSVWDGGQLQRDLDHVAEQMWLRKVSSGLLTASAGASRSAWFIVFHSHKAINGYAADIEMTRGVRDSSA
jgi:hypothetical protein